MLTLGRGPQAIRREREGHPFQSRLPCWRVAVWRLVSWLSRAVWQFLHDTGGTEPAPQPAHNFWRVRNCRVGPPRDTGSLRGFRSHHRTHSVYNALVQFHNRLPMSLSPEVSSLVKGLEARVTYFFTLVTLFRHVDGCLCAGS